MLWATPDGRFQADVGHGLLELLAVLGLLDGVLVGADQLDVVLLQHAVVSRSSAQFSAVWPPIVGSSASGFSRSMIFSTACR